MKDPNTFATPPWLAGLSKRQLVEKLQSLIGNRAAEASAAHELNVHQIELEMQNRSLRDAQLRLETSYELVADLFEKAPVGYCVIALDGTIGRLNTKAAEMLNMPIDSLLGARVQDVVAYRDRQDLENLLRASREGKHTFKLALTPSRGQLRHLQLDCAPEYDEHDVITGFRLTLADITAVKQLETHLRLLAHVGVLLAADLDYTVTVPRALSASVPCLGETCFIDIAADSLRPHRFWPQDAKETESYDRLYPLRGAHTPQTMVVASGSPVRSAVPNENSRAASNSRSIMIVPLSVGGTVVGCLTCLRSGDEAYGPQDMVVAQELAYRVALAIHAGRLHAEAQRESRTREYFLGMVSHDLKGILASMLLNGEMLVRGSKREGRDCAQSIVRQTHRMNRLIEDLLDAASIERGHLSIEASPQCAKNIVDEACREAQLRASDKGLTVAHDVRGDIYARCDHGRTLQVLGNLLGNAIKFTPEGRRIDVHGQRHHNEVLFSVVDEGCGLSDDDMAHVFDFFWHCGKTASGGHGLGLAIARGIVSTSGGRIWAERRPRGTAFHFTLPAARTPLSAACG